MFHYMMTPLHQHFDLGFGSMADSFKDAAESVQHASQEERGLNEHLPVSFLYRHAIELYLKSAIIIFHRKFNIPYGTEPSTSEPHIPIGTKWKSAYQIHSLPDLYSYFCQLFSNHATYLEENTRTNWTFPPDLVRWIDEIEQYDSTSTFFRYPVTKNRDKDQEKSVIKADSPKNIVAFIGADQKPEKAFFVLNEEDEVTQSFYRNDDKANAIIDTLRSASEILYGCHTALRAELCDGW